MNYYKLSKGSWSVTQRYDTLEQSEQVLVKFRDILAFAQTGAITSIQNYLPLIPTDEVFTQERKDKYIQMINDYLNQF